MAFFVKVLRNKPPPCNMATVRHKHTEKEPHHECRHHYPTRHYRTHLPLPRRIRRLHSRPPTPRRNMRHHRRGVRRGGSTHEKELTINANSTICEKLGAEIRRLAPPGSVEYSYLMIRVTAPNGRRLFIERPHDKTGTWRIRPTNQLGTLPTHGTRHDRETTIKIALHFAKTGELK